MNSRNAPQMSITDTATSAATIARRARSWAPDEPRAALLSAAAAEPIDMRSAGRSPTSSETTSAVTAANASTRRLSVTSAVNGIGGSSGTATRISSAARPTPATAAEQAEHQRLDQQLSGDAAAAGAERGAHGDLLPAGGALRKQQVGDVGAGDEEHEDDGAQRDVDRLSQRFADQQLVERLDRHAPVLLPGGDECRRSARGRRARPAGPGRCVTPGLEAAHRVQPVHARGQLAFVEGVQPPEAGGFLEWPAALPVERARRQHADDLMGLAVEEQLPAEDAAIGGEVALPRRVADHHRTGRRPAGPPPA